MKFMEYFYESESKESPEQKQIDKGIEVEKEHTNLWDIFDTWATENELDLPIDETTFYETIAKAHVKEIPDYYDRLDKMESEAKEEVDESFGNSPTSPEGVMSSSAGVEMRGF